MRIISGKHDRDFYDNIQSYDRSDVIYRRENSKIILLSYKGSEYKKSFKKVFDIFDSMPDGPYLFDKRLSNYERGHKASDKFLLGFCGQIVPFYKLERGIESFFDIDSIKTFLVKEIEEEKAAGRGYNSVYKEVFLDHLNKVDKEKSFRSNRFAFSTEGFSKWKENTDLKIENAPFLSINSPVFVLSKKTEFNFSDSKYETRTIIEVNPNMKSWGLHKYFNPVQAYQEIDMYLGNVLVQRDNPDIPRTDELIRDQKGFDKWSFRTMPKKGNK